jgi:hypothetical protein
MSQLLALLHVCSSEASTAKKLVLHIINLPSWNPCRWALREGESLSVALERLQKVILWSAIGFSNSASLGSR